MSIIYKITNTMTGKQYIGQTSKTINERFDVHTSNSKTLDTYLYRAIRKYGIRNFTIEVIDVVAPDDANDREQYWIRELNTLVPNGYNMTIGGTGGDTSTSPNYIEAMANRRSYQGADNPNFGKKGELSPNFGKTRTCAQLNRMKAGVEQAWADNIPRKQKASIRMMGDRNHMFGKKPPNAKKVDFDGKIYDSLADAIRSTGRSAQYIKKHGKVLHE